MLFTMGLILFVAIGLIIKEVSRIKKETKKDKDKREADESKS